MAPVTSVRRSASVAAHLLQFLHDQIAKREGNVGVNARKYTKENRARLTYMSDDELLAYQRELHGDPYMSLGTAKELRKTAVKFWHLGGGLGAGQGGGEGKRPP